MTSIHVNFVVLLLVFVLFSSISARNITGIQANFPDFKDSIPAPGNFLRVFVLPVGQGDCTFIQCPNGNIAIFDCGSRGGNRLEPYQIRNWLGGQINRVSHIFISHSDIDHHIFLPDIFCDDYNANMFVIIGGRLDDYSSANPKYDRTYAWLKKLDSNGRLVLINNGYSCMNTKCFTKQPLNNICNDENYKFYILAANIGPSANEKSIVMKIIATGGWSMLLSGDMEGRASEQIVAVYGKNLQSRVYQMSHHGASRRANNIEWIKAIYPVYAFASSGYDFGNCRHPRCDTIDRLNDYGHISETTTPHKLYCGENDGTTRNYETYTRNILETSPTDKDICYLMYQSVVNTLYESQFVCRDFPQSKKPSQLAGDEAVYDDDCGDDDFEFDEAAGGGAPSME